MAEKWPLRHEKPLVGLSMGHNVFAPGAYGYYKMKRITEFEMIEKVVRHIEKYFERQGLTDILYVPKTNHLTREELLRDAGTARELSATIKFFNQRTVDWAIELHFNAASPNRQGNEVFFAKGSKKGEILAKFFSGRLTEWCGPGYAKDDTKTYVHSLYGKGLGFCRLTKMSATLLEPCFLSNSNNMEKLMTSWKLLADIIAETILDGLNRFWEWERMK